MTAPTQVRVGQTWEPARDRYGFPLASVPVVVVARDRAAVFTDRIGRTTVFRLLRHYRLVSDPDGGAS